MELVPLSDTAAIIVAGGDDNAISASLLKIGSDGSTQVATVLIPDAHTAATTTLKILRQQPSPAAGSGTAPTTLTVASSGTDHRVKIWAITADPTQHAAQRIRVEFLLDRYSAVADISSLGLIKASEHEGKLLVCGVGMEMLRIKF